MCAFRKGKPDRVPIFIRGVRVFDEGWLEWADQSYRLLIDYVSAHCDIVHFWSGGRGFLLCSTEGLQRTSEVIDQGQDYVTRRVTIETPRGPIYRERRYSTVEWRGETLRRFVQDQEDLERALSVPYVPVLPDVADFVKKDREVGGAGVVMPIIPCAAILLHEIIGSELLASWSVLQRKLVLEALEVLNARVRGLVKHLLDAGVGPVLGLSGEELVTPPLQSPQDFRDFVYDFDREIISLIHDYDCLVDIHCHGNLGSVLELFADMGCDSLHPVECKPWGDITLEEFRQRVGNRITIKGNIQIADLIESTPEDIRAQVKHLIEVAGKDGALILAPSASPYLKPLPEKSFLNYKAMIDAGLEYGRYA